MRAVIVVEEIWKNKTFSPSEKNGVVGMVDGKQQILVGPAGPQMEEQKKYDDGHIAEQSDRDKWQL